MKNQTLIAIFVFLAYLNSIYCLVYVRVTKKVIFDITIDNEPAGKIVIGLFGEIVPKTVKNFAELADRPFPNGYIGKDPCLYLVKIIFIFYLLKI